MVFLCHLFHGQERDRVAQTPEYLFRPLKDSFLFGIFFRVVEKHLPPGEFIDRLFQAFLPHKHTCGNDGDIIKPCPPQRCGRSSEFVSERPEVSLSHAKLVCSMIFLAFFLPRCT
jgi:hypothetical protein